jgi:hypothetical protein
VDERVAQRKLGLDRVAVSPPLALPQNVTVVHQLGEDLVRSALGDANGSGDVAEANSGIFGYAEQDMSVIGEEVPATCSRTG